MDKLSTLLKEAKPLYRQRKRQKAIAKAILVLTLPAIIITSGYQVYLKGDNLYLSLTDNSLQNELMQDEYGLFGTK